MGRIKRVKANLRLQCACQLLDALCDVSVGPCHFQKTLDAVFERLLYPSLRGRFTSADESRSHTTLRQDGLFGHRYSH